MAKHAMVSQVETNWNANQVTDKGLIDNHDEDDSAALPRPEPLLQRLPLDGQRDA
jgi:hypothetical protein